MDITYGCFRLHATLYVNSVEIQVSCIIVKGYNSEITKMSSDAKPTSTLQKNAEVLHVLYGLLDSDREPTDEDAQSLRALYASS